MLAAKSYIQIILLTIWFLKTKGCSPVTVVATAEAIATKINRMKAETNKSQEAVEVEEVTEVLLDNINEEPKVDKMMEEPEYYTQDYEVSGVYVVKNFQNDTDDILEEEYPVFPPLTAENLTSPDYNLPDLEDDELDIYDQRFDHLYDEYLSDHLYDEYLPAKTKTKRDTAEVITDLAESGAKLLSGNLIGGVTSFVKSLAKPIFSYFIHSNNDHAMARFTSRLLPETDYKDTPQAHLITKAAQQGDGEGVWHQMSSKVKVFNPRSNFVHDQYHQDPTHIECRRNIPMIDRNQVRRLKSVTMMISNLVTALHDTTIADLNIGFEKASKHFQEIKKTNSKILNATINNAQSDLVIELIKEAVDIVEKIQEDNMSKEDEFIMAGLIGVAIVSIFLLGGIMVAHIRKNNCELKEIKALVSPPEVQDSEEDKTRRAMVAALKEYLDTAAGQMMAQNNMMHSPPTMLQVANSAIRQSVRSENGIPRGYVTGPAVTFQQ